MATITINGKGQVPDQTIEIPDAAARYIADLESDVQRALDGAKAAEARVREAEQKTLQAVADGEAKVKAAETKLIGWITARAHSFFNTLDGDFRNVKGFLSHMSAGLALHMQPQTLTAAPMQAAAQPQASTPAAPASSSPEAPAPAAPAKPAAQPAETSATPQG
jgi:hypothetical protein